MGYGGIYKNKGAIQFNGEINVKMINKFFNN